jgi:hypothetical protein
MYLHPCSRRDNDIRVCAGSVPVNDAALYVLYPYFEDYFSIEILQIEYKNYKQLVG